jgi:predicted DsbA family dithiol-disulfide isomerase
MTSNSFACSASTGICSSDDADQSLRVSVTVVTDPLCSACWAFEPAWRKFLHHHGERISLDHVYGVLLPGWEGFSDPGAGISGPEDVAPHWREVALRSGQPINIDVWRDDPVTSTVPAAVALLRVRDRVPDAEHAYLRRLRELVMAEGRNIARPEVLSAGARDVGVPRDQANDVGAAPSLESRSALEAERQRMRSLGARSFPTVVFQHNDQRVAFAGAQPYERLLTALEMFTGEKSPRDVAGAEPRSPRDSVAEALAAYGSATTREVAEFAGVSDATAEAELPLLAIRSHSGVLWNTAAQPTFVERKTHE